MTDPAALVEAKKLATYINSVRHAVNASCTCGGKGPDDECCPACEVWHRLQGLEIVRTDIVRSHVRLSVDDPGHERITRYPVHRGDDA